MLSVEEVRARVLACARAIAETEMLATEDAVGRVLAQPVLATVDVPALDNSQMDGYAVRCAEVAQVPARLPLRGRFAAGQAPGILSPGCAARIFTGAAIPEGCDAVVMQEATKLEGDHVVVREAPRRGEWIRRAGSDIAKGATALQAGQGLRPQHLGVAASVGAAKLTVVRKPRVALLCTGDELATPGEQAAPGQIYNSNRYLLAGLIRMLGCELQDLGMIPDRLDATKAALAEAAQGNDLVVSTGGVSVGEEDHVKAAVLAVGRLDLWKIAMKPGKPLAFGSVRGSVRDVPFLGLPGNPVSSFITFVLFVRPLLEQLMGLARRAPAQFEMRADFQWEADPERREFLRARRNERGGLDLFPSQNSALLSSVAWADGLVDVPAGAGVSPGQLVPFLPLSDLTGPVG
jgi:molybdopterin molybdotransferase